MALTPSEKAMADAAYARVKSGLRTRGGIIGGISGMMIGVVPSFIQDVSDPHSSRKETIFISACLGLVFGGCAVASYFVSRQRKRDEELVSFFEKRFPGECSWKQEEKILAEVEDIRLKAKVANLIHERA